VLAGTFTGLPYWSSSAPLRGLLNPVPTVAPSALPLEVTTWETAPATFVSGAPPPVRTADDATS